MPVRHEIVSDLVKPRLERYTAFDIRLDVDQRPVKHPCREVFGIVVIACAKVHVGIYLLDVPLVQFSECGLVLMGHRHEIGVVGGRIILTVLCSHTCETPLIRKSCASHDYTQRISAHTMSPLRCDS